MTTVNSEVDTNTKLVLSGQDSSVLSYILEHLNEYEIRIEKPLKKDEFILVEASTNRFPQDVIGQFQLLNALEVIYHEPDPVAEYCHDLIAIRDNVLMVAHYELPKEEYGIECKASLTLEMMTGNKEAIRKKADLLADEYVKVSLGNHVRQLHLFMNRNAKFISFASEDVIKEALIFNSKEELEPSVLGHQVSLSYVLKNASKEAAVINQMGLVAQLAPNLCEVTFDWDFSHDDQGNNFQTFSSYTLKLIGGLAIELPYGEEWNDDWTNEILEHNPNVFPQEILDAAADEDVSDDDLNHTIVSHLNALLGATKHDVFATVNSTLDDLVYFKGKESENLIYFRDDTSVSTEINEVSQDTAVTA